MAAPLTPDQLIAAFRKWKVPFREYPGWRTRGRPQTWGPVHGVITHHTGSDSQSDGYLEFLFVDGRASEGIPAPLCQFATKMDGTVWIGAAGRANQAGKGSSTTLDKVIGENYPGYTSEINPGPDGIDGNARYYGNEVMYDGGQAMTPAQYRSAVLVCAAICDAHGWSALSAIGHREHSGRKWDPGKTNMAQFRRDVRDTLAAGPSGAVTEELFTVGQYEDLKAAIGAVATEVAYVQAQAKSIAGLIVDVPANVSLQWLGRSGPAIGTAIQATYQGVQALAADSGVDVPPIDVKALAAELAPMLAAAVRAELADDVDLTGDEVEARVEAAVRRVFGDAAA